MFNHSSILNSSHKTLTAELQPNLLAPFALIRGFAQQTKTGKIITGQTLFIDGGQNLIET